MVVQSCKLALVLFALAATASANEVDSATGLVLAPGFELVSTQCIVCHSSRLIIQNRADRKGWISMIRWMQETQGLWPLGTQEDSIIDYLATYYAPRPSGRRPPLPDNLLPPGEPVIETNP